MDDPKDIASLAQKLASEANYLAAVTKGPYPTFQARPMLVELIAHAKDMLDAVNKIEAGK